MMTHSTRSYCLIWYLTKKFFTISLNFSIFKTNYSI